jgi:hypothetical protein
MEEKTKNGENYTKETSINFSSLTYIWALNKTGCDGRNM